MKKYSPKKFWPPLYSGFGLGFALFSMFLVTGHGLGAYGFFKRLAIQISDWLEPTWAQSNDFFHSILSGAQPLNTWVSWEIAGVAIGALVASLVGRRFHFTIEKGANVSRSHRLAFALIGGILTGFGAALARGCTSGLGLSGGAVLSVAGFLFLIVFFISGIIVSRWTRRIW